MPPDLAWIVGGAFLSAFAVGAAGFADALIASALWLHVLAPAEAVPLIVGSGFVIHSLALGRLRASLDFSRVLPFVAGGALGVPLGAWALGYAEPGPFRLGVGVFLVLYGLYSLVQPFAGTLTRGGRVGDGAVGVIGGFLGGLAGMSGIVPAVWSGLRGWTRQRQRGIYQPYCVVMHAMAFAWLAWGGLATARLWLALAWSVPAIVLGLCLGLALYDRLDERWFGRIVSMLLLGAGALLVV